MSQYFEKDDFEEEFETIIMTGDLGEEVEFVIIDHLQSEGSRYILVVQRGSMDEDETEAMILKEESILDDDVTYSVVQEDEFDKIADLFSKNDGEYDVEIDE